MKYLLLLFSLVMVCCGPSKEELDARAREKKAKFRDGQIVHIKPDSAKVAIIEVDRDMDWCNCTADEQVKYKIRDAAGNLTSVPESLIYDSISP